ncbi:MAG: PGF-CTERM-anchored ABC transporter substrate-binding protein [Halobacteriales archaeon]
MERIRPTVLITIVIVAMVGAPVASGVVQPARAQEDTCSFPYTATDATGTEVTIDEEPQRIVTLNPSAAQTMWELNAEEKVVGVSIYADYLDGAEDRTIVYDRDGAKLEEIVALQPDLVLAPNTISNDTVNKIRETGLTVYRFDEAISIEFIYEKTKQIGRLTGECDAADDTVADMRRTITTVEEAVRGVNRSRVIYTFFGFTAGDGTFIHEIIETAGGRNMAAEAGISGYRQLNPEVVVDTNPEWIVLNTDDPSVPKTDAYNSTYAVKNNQTVVLNADYISQPAPRIVQPIRVLAQTMYPDAYDDAKFGSGGKGASFAISNATLNRSRLTPGDEVLISATVTNNGSDEGTFTAELYVNDSLKTFTDTRLAPGETTTITFTREFHRDGTYEIRFNDESAGMLQVSETIVTPTPSPTPTAPTETPTPTGQTETEVVQTTAPSTETETIQPTAQSGTETAETPTQTATTTPTPTGTTDAEQPGFGFIIGVVAVLFVGLYRRHTAS